MLFSSFSTRSMVFAYFAKAQLPFFSFESFLTIRQNSLYVTVCMIVRTFYQGYFIHSLSTLHYCNAPSLTTRLTGDYRDRTYTGKCGPASLDTLYKKDAKRKFLFPLHLLFFSYILLKINNRFPIKQVLFSQVLQALQIPLYHLQQAQRAFFCSYPR